METKEIIVLDIETTGLNSKKDFILELGIVSLNLETGEVKELFDKVFKEPGLNASHRDAWIFKNNFMSIEEVKKAESIENYRIEIQNILNPFKGKITAWNRNCDEGFLVENGFDLGERLQCPMKVSTTFFKIPKNNRHSGFKWPKAQEAWDILFPDVKKIELHRGLDDSKMEAKIIHELYKRGVYKPF